MEPLPIHSPMLKLVLQLMPSLHHSGALLHKTILTFQCPPLLKRLDPPFTTIFSCFSSSSLLESYLFIFSTGISSIISQTKHAPFAPRPLLLRNQIQERPHGPSTGLRPILAEEAGSHRKNSKMETIKINFYSYLSDYMRGLEGQEWMSKWSSISFRDSWGCSNLTPAWKKGEESFSVTLIQVVRFSERHLGTVAHFLCSMQGCSARLCLLCWLMV